ncbi:MAG: DUF3999 family protein [Desulfobacterales bacterium]|jgi:hypothetical protein
MKHILVMMIFLATATVTEAAFDPAGWNWQRPILTRAKAGFVRLPITPEVLDQSQAGLNDLRVLDSDMNLVPHVIHWGRVQDETFTDWLPAQLLNETFIPEQSASVTMDFGEMIKKNQIRVDLSETNYRRRALLEGGNDGASWEVVAEDLWLFDVSYQGRNFKLNTLKFPQNNFRYLRLTVYNMADDPRKITIESVQAAFYRVASQRELEDVPVEDLQITNDAETNRSIIDLDLGFRNLPVVIMECAVSTPFFYRGYELYGRNQATEKVRRKTESGWQEIEENVAWKKVHKGVLYRTYYNNKTRASLTFEGFNAPFRYLQLRVFNGDNPPLQLDRVKLFRRHTSLVFQAQAQQTYTLLGGNLSAGPPDFDLAKAVRGVEDFSMPVVQPGTALILQADEQEELPWSERHAGVILVVLIAATGIMAIIIIKSLKGISAKKRAR